MTELQFREWGGRALKETIFQHYMGETVKVQMQEDIFSAFLAPVFYIRVFVLKYGKVEKIS